jgi:pyruvate,orthophosphate dikinase
MFGNSILDIEKWTFDKVLDAKKNQRKTKLDTDLTAKDLQEVTVEYKQVLKKHAKRDFPQDPREQLAMARDAAFRSWSSDRGRHYRRLQNISDDLGTAVNVQVMVYGNLGDTSGAGVGFTRNPATGDKEVYGEFLMNALGEDVVSGVRTPLPILKLQKIMPDVYNQLRDITTRLEKLYRDMQDFEFIIQSGKLYLLQTRNGRRTGPAAVRVAIDMVEDGLITKEQAIFRVEPNQLHDFLVPRLDERDLQPQDVLARALPASRGAAVGQIVFTSEEAVKKAGQGAKKNPVILVRTRTTPVDICGMEVACGILTSGEHLTAPVAHVARAMGKPCVVGAYEVEVDEKAREMRVRGQVFKEGDWISVDGTTGRVLKGKRNTIPIFDVPDLLKFMGWADSYRTMKVRANAEISRDAIQARAFGAEGIGLCRTEHMFFGEKKIPHMRAMILADNEKDRRAALKKLLPMQREDFAGLFKAMDGLPVTIRLLDPPLHEFLPRREDLMLEIAALQRVDAKEKKRLVARYSDYGATAVGDLKKPLASLLNRVEQLHEFNPLLGHRGCRLGITYPEITEMQSRAIFEAAVDVAKKGVKVYPEVMIPMTATLKEMANQSAIVRHVANEVFTEKGKTVDYLVGALIELPRAALLADQIAKEAEFFSFGTNDLTQTTWGLSREDAKKVLPTYLAEGIIKEEPFAVLDQDGVGQLVKMATERGRKTRPDLKVGICGEHGGEPSSVEFCHQAGLDYVSCSPSRVLTARLAAAQAGLLEKLKAESTITR